MVFQPEVTKKKSDRWTYRGTTRYYYWLFGKVKWSRLVMVKTNFPSLRASWRNKQEYHEQKLFKNYIVNDHSCNVAFALNNFLRLKRKLQSLKSNSVQIDALVSFAASLHFTWWSSLTEMCHCNGIILKAIRAKQLLME